MTRPECQNDPRRQGDLAAEFARQNGVSRSSVFRAVLFARGVDAIEERITGTRAIILSGRTRLRKGWIEKIGASPWVMEDPEILDLLKGHLR